MKQSLAIVFGGQSSEHEISCMSAVNIIRCVNKERYRVILIGITREGKWVKAESAEDIASGAWRNSGKRAIILPDAEKKAVLYQREDGSYEEERLDVIFPVLHGMYGEDGTIQGIFEMARIPYVGCGVLASAVSMDKLYTKIIVNTLGIRQAAYVGVHRRELQKMEDVISRIEAKIPYPVFVKPSCAGSSKGVSKAADRKELRAALTEAARHDKKILVEETIVGREVECAVLGGKTVEASGVGEIRAAAEFYDFDAKYFNADSQTDTKPDIEARYVEEIRKDAAEIFCAVGGCGLSRVDFFLTEEGVVFNEINTLPGFTAISMYPMLWEEKGIDKETLIQKLIDTAFTREEDESTTHPLKGMGL